MKRYMTIRKIFLFAVASMIGAFSSGVFAQTYSPTTATKLVLCGGGGASHINTLTLLSGALAGPKTYTFPTPVLGIFHSDASGGLTLSAINLNSTSSSDVTGILQPINGGTGVNNGTNTFTYTGGNLSFTLGGNTSLTLPTSGTLIASAGALTAKGVVSTDASGNLVSTALTNGQVLIGSTGNVPVAATLTAGSNITITPSAGGITIASTGGGGGGVTYDVTSTQNTAVVAASNYLFDVAYASTAAAQNALGARISSTNTTAGANHNANGLTINATATTWRHGYRSCSYDERR